MIVHILLQTLLKELEEFAHKGIPDVRGCKAQDAQILEEMVSHRIFYYEGQSKITES